MTSILQRFLASQLQGSNIAFLPPQTYECDNEYGAWLWNVTLANQLAPTYNRPCLLDLEPLAGHVYDPTHDPEPDEPRYPIHRGHALGSNNRAPIILIQVAHPGRPGQLLFETVIDGWHRIYHALEHQNPALPCWIIPTHAEPAYRLFHQPPGART